MTDENKTEENKIDENKVKELFEEIQPRLRAEGGGEITRFEISTSQLVEFQSDKNGVFKPRTIKQTSIKITFTELPNRLADKRILHFITADVLIKNKIPFGSFNSKLIQKIKKPALV